ncbi:MAG TPA: sigma-70 family RNA polymerase sigma factor [Bryobacteraceae bacterium]|nr:sigma-70 family RNA polymerase sigma factor [Bryobacteraceae bacterium]
MAADASDSLAVLPIVEAARAERPSSLEEEVVALFDRHRGPLLRYLYSFQITVPDAEEIIQEVFLSLFRHLRESKSRANLHGWIFKVAHNLALRNRVRGRRHSERFTYMPAVSAIAADPAPGPEEALAARQRRERLLAVVRALPEQDQFCLSLRAEGLRYREIAEVLGISLGSVANSIEKSMGRLMRSEGNSNV